MENKFRQFFTAEDIVALGPEELVETAGGATESTNEVKCPVCKRYYPIREIKAHIQSAHGGY